MNANATRHPPLDELSAWVDGEIAGEPERRVLAEHVASCPSCASLAADFRALAGAQVSAAIPPVPPRLQGRILERLASEGRFGRRPVRRYVLPLGAAATVLVGVVALWLVRHQSVQPPRLEARDTMQAPARESAPAVGPVESAPTAAPNAALSVPPPPPPPASGATAEPKRKTIARQNAVEGTSKDDVAGATGYAPAPAPQTLPPQEERAAAGAVEQHAVAMKQAGSRWTRMPPSAGERFLGERQEQEQEEMSKRSDAAQEAPAAPSPATAPEMGDLRRLASNATDACPVLDLLEPALALQGFDLERGRQLGERARGAGATITSLEPVPRLTLIVPAPAWEAVWKALADEGIAIPGAARTSPAGAGCLVVAIEGLP